MPIVGLTGGFGTGKSYAASIFKKLGSKVIDADKLARKALKKGSVAYKRVVEVFGKSILDSKGYIKRKTLGKIVFNDKKLLADLNKIVHPYVISRIENSIKASKNEVLIIDAPLICETSLSDLVDVLVVVKASRKNQVDRCVKKFYMKKEDVCKRMACQMPLKEKINKADYIIDNDGTRKETVIQVKQIWQDLKKGEFLWR